MELEQELNIVCEQLDESGGSSALLVKGYVTFVFMKVITKFEVVVKW